MMPRRTHISSILNIGPCPTVIGRLRLHRYMFAILLVLVFWTAAAGAQPVPVAARQPTAVEQRELERLARHAERWAEEARERHGLLSAHCRIAGPGIERSSCRFQGDGVAVSLAKPGRAPGTPAATLLSFGTVLDHRGGRLTLAGGGWIRDGDLFEVEAGGGVHVFSCAREPSEGSPVKCLPIADLRQVLRRLRFPRARYSSGAGFDSAAGRAFADGTIRFWRNGSAVDLKPLIAAAGDFARQDFETVAASAAPPPLPAISFGPISEEESRENARLVELARTWAQAVRARNGLSEGQCSFGGKSPGSYCGFDLDGISLRTGRDLPDLRQVKAELSFGHLWKRRENQAIILRGAWFKAGDLFELVLGEAVYPYLCRSRVPEHPQVVQCAQVRDFAAIAGRASFPRARYRLTDPPAEAAVGQALVEGRIALRHNGRPRTLAPLIGAARDFAREDFKALAEAR